MTGLWSRAIKGALLLIIPASVCAAQGRPVVFVHGLLSNGSTWAEASARLQEDLAIDSRRPDLASVATYERQAAELQTKLGTLPGSTIAVGHSNGGVVAREWSRQHQLSGIITLGTPNGGAPLVGNFLSWVEFPGALSAAIANVYGRFEDCDFEGCGFQDLLYSRGLDQLIRDLPDVGNRSIRAVSAQLGIDVSAPVFPEMIPSSAYLADLNSPANVAREQAAVPSRVGIISVAHNWYQGGPVRAAFPNYADAFVVIRDAALVALDDLTVFIHLNADPWNQTAYRLTTDMSRAGLVLAGMDRFWCEMVSVPGGGACWENDTIVPIWSQVLAGATDNIRIQDGPAHIQETAQGAAALYQVLTYHMNVLPRSGSGNGEGEGAAGTVSVGSSSMHQDSAVRGCSGYSELAPVSRPNQDACTDYCRSNAASACEWNQDGSCYAEFGTGCSVQGGFGGWWAGVLDGGGSVSGGPTTSAKATGGVPDDGIRLSSRFLTQNTAIRGCSGYSERPATSQPTPDACATYCQSTGANACEWTNEGACYAEFGTGCSVQPGFGGWWGGVFNTGAAAPVSTPPVVASTAPAAPTVTSPSLPTPQMRPESSVRGCSNYSEAPVVYQPDANACLSYCVQSGADACEWTYGGSCYAEHGNGCHVEGYSGWFAAVLH